MGSWTTLYRAAVIRNHKPILEASTESEFPENPVKYHRNCRAEFTNKRDLQVANKPSDDAATGNAPTGNAPRRSSRDGNQPSSAILPDQCLFCKKSKYKPNTKTREKLHSVQEFRADETVRAFASFISFIIRILCDFLRTSLRIFEYPVHSRFFCRTKVF